ncbi:MAG: glycosyltransferase family 4 protein [Burkholderiales bacterium]
MHFTVEFTSIILHAATIEVAAASESDTVSHYLGWTRNGTAAIRTAIGRERLRILHTEASLGWGGQEIRVLSEARGLIERGHIVHLAVPGEARAFGEALKRKVPVTALPIGRKNLRGLRAMRRHLLAHPVDVINVHSSTDSWLAALACATVRNAPPIVRTRHISAPIPNNIATRWLYGSATRRIVTTGEALRRQIIEANRLPPDKVLSVPTGIDLDRFAPVDRDAARASLGLGQGVHYIGIVATLRSWKGHLHLLEAMTHLTDSRLLIIGDGPMRDVIEARIASLGLGGRVTLTSHQDDPAPWLNALDAFCLPSYANEGVPQALMQAMAMGLPVVTTPVGSITEIVRNEETGLIVPPANSQAIAAAITRLRDDAELADRIGRAARAYAMSTFGAARMLDRMEQVFRDAVAG